MYIIGAILFFGGIIVTLSGFVPAIFLTVFSGIFFAIANAISENIPKSTLQTQINKMFEKGDIIGKKLNNIEDIIESIRMLIFQIITIVYIDGMIV